MYHEEIHGTSRTDMNGKCGVATTNLQIMSRVHSDRSQGKTGPFSLPGLAPASVSPPLVMMQRARELSVS